MISGKIYFKLYSTKGSLVVGRWSADHLPTTFLRCSLFTITWNDILPRGVVTSNTKMPQGFSKKELAEPLYDLEERIAEPYKNDFPELARAVSGSLLDFTLCEFAGGLVDWRMKRRTHARRQERLMDDPVALGSLRLQIGSIWPCLLFLLESASVIVMPRSRLFLKYSISCPFLVIVKSHHCTKGSIIVLHLSHVQVFFSTSVHQAPLYYPTPTAMQ